MKKLWDSLQKARSLVGGQAHRMAFRHTHDLNQRSVMVEIWRTLPRGTDGSSTVVQDQEIKTKNNTIKDSNVEEMGRRLLQDTPQNSLAQLSQHDVRFFSSGICALP